MYARLGKISVDRMNRLAKRPFRPYFQVDLDRCESYLGGKAIRKPFGKKTKAEVPLQLIHSDICGPMNLRLRHRAFYFVTFIDNYTQFGYLYLIFLKSEVLECFRRYITLVKSQLERTRL